MSSSSEATVTDRWAPALDLSREGMSRFDPALVERAIEDGYRAGFEAGREEGRAAGERELDADRAELRATAADLLRSFAAATDACAREQEATSAAFAARAAEVAVRLAAAIVGRELADETQAAVAACERALTALGRSGHARLRLHPDDIALLGDGDLPADVELEPDPTLDRGDALAHTADRTVDARISTALERALRALEATS